MKHYSLFFGAFIAICFLLSCSQKDGEISVTSVIVSQPSAEMIIGETIKLTATISPSNATNKSIKWSSSKQSVATVSDDGLVTAISEGASSIMAMASSGKSGSCIVTVSNPGVAVTSIELNKKELYLAEGEEATLIATVKPDNASIKTISWTSSDSSVALVDDKGKVRALKEGEAVITAKNGNITAQCRVYVTSKKIDVSMILLSQESADINIGESLTLKITIVPDNATEQNVRWGSSNSDIASVNEGTITGISEGRASIVAYAGGKTATCEVTVHYIPVESISLSHSTLTLYEGEKQTLVPSVLPSNASYPDAKWSSSNSEIANVDDGGQVTAIAKGKAKVTALCEDKMATCDVTILRAMTGIIISPTEITVSEGCELVFTVSIIPEDATPRSQIEWTSSDPDVVKNVSGKMIAVGEGTAIVTVKQESFYASCTVTCRKAGGDNEEIDEEDWK